MRFIKRNFWKILCVILIICVIGGLAAWWTNTKNSETGGHHIVETETISMSSVETETTSLSTDLSCTITVIDVGQGNAVLVKSENEAMLIDCGEADRVSNVFTALQEKGVYSLKYVVGTHPHVDHIGGMRQIVDAIPITDGIMFSGTATSKTWLNLMDMVESKGISVITPVVGMEYVVGDALCTIVAPCGSDYSDLNDYSIGIRITCGENSFLCTGDAESFSEKEMIASGEELDSDVLLVPHHGSDSSSTWDFLAAVTPEICIISVGANNDYGHPTAWTLERLESVSERIYRTDEDGNITVTFNSKGIVITRDRIFD